MPFSRSLFRSLLCSCFAAVFGVAAAAPTSAQFAPALAPATPRQSPATYIPPDNTADLLTIDPAMREYFEHAVPPGVPTRQLLHQLVDFVLSPKGFGFVYDTQSTFDARTTFRQRRGNCVGFSFFMVALARHYGFDATFQNVDMEPQWDRFGTLVASIVHLNVRVSGDDGESVVDLRPDLIPRFDPEIMHPIRDERAFAQFYNDIGFFLLVQNRPEQALHYLTRATEIDGRYAAGWSNLGTVYLRFSNLTGARAAFERSLRADRSAFTSLTGLVDVLTRLGTPADLREAAKYERRAERIREKNPYFQEHLATVAANQADWTTAEKHLLRAISLKGDEPDFYRDLAATQRRLGREDEARRTDAKLQKLLASRNPALAYGTR